MAIRHILVLALLLAPMRSALAECTCLWEGSFADVYASADIIVAGTVRANRGNAVDVEIGEILQGAEPAPPLRVWMQTGNHCRPSATDFPIGTQWVMALHRIDDEPPDSFNPHTPNTSYGRLGDYSLSACGGYWLRLQGEHVSGNLIDGTRWERDPPMSPVLLEIVGAYVRGEAPREALVKASTQDPALRQLMLETRTFLIKEK